MQAGSGDQHNTEIEDGVSHLEILPREEKQFYWKCKTAYRQYIFFSLKLS